MSEDIIVAIIVAIPGTLAAFISLLALRQGRTTHQLVNSRMTELLGTSVGEAHAVGKAEGEQAQRDRDAPSTLPGASA